MTNLNLSSEVVTRLLQVTRRSWMQSPSTPLAVFVPSSQKLSSHRIAVQRNALNKRMSWGLQPMARTARPLEG